MNIRFTLNGENVSVDCHPLESLQAILRRDFRLRGTKQGCRNGECSGCLVFVGEFLSNSCLTPAFRLEGKRVLTIEGFVKTREYADIEKAFLAKDIFLCGFCTPSLVLAAESLLLIQANPGRDEIENYLAGNLCHYTGSRQIIDAIRLAAEYRRKRRADKRGKFYANP